jgi:RND family efflux transporter MFP subunit
MLLGKIVGSVALVMLAVPGAIAEPLKIELRPVTELKAVYGTVEARDIVPARARIGGTLVALAASEGDVVAAGQVLATVIDEKIDFQIQALEARLGALRSEQENAVAEFRRGEELVQRGVATAQRLEALQTQVTVIANNISAAKAERQLLEQRRSEGEVLAPADGRILTVPVTEGVVVLPGETIASIGSGGFFLRLAIPERHGAVLREGATIEIETGSGKVMGVLAKIYPQIENGRVIADVTVPSLQTALLGARVLVRLPVGERLAILVPAAAVETRSGLDFVTVIEAGAETERVVVPGRRVTQDGVEFVEVLSGLAAGDEVIVR